MTCDNRLYKYDHLLHFRKQNWEKLHRLFCGHCVCIHWQRWYRGDSERK